MACHSGRNKRNHRLEVGKYADFVELSADITAVNPNEILNKVKVQGTWLGGKKIDTTMFIEQINAIDPTQHQGMGEAALKNAHSH